MEPPEDLRFATLQTERLVITPLRSHHGEGLWAAVCASVDDLHEWMPWARPPKKEDTIGLADNSADEWYRRVALSFAVLLQDTVIGLVSLRLRPLQHSAEIGYHLRADLKGKGYMTEAVGAVLGYAFRQEDLHRIELRAGVGNHGSIRVAEKNGFTHIGTAREADPAPEGWRDLLLYDLLAGEFQQPHEE